MSQRWAVALSNAAQRDFFGILHWTGDRFGKRQARVYANTLRSALNELHRGPQLPGCRLRPEIGPNISVLHVARNGRKGRHVVLLRVNEETQTLEVLRILHDSMDLVQHIK